MHNREERSRNTEAQIRFLVYTLEIASKLADASGTLLELFFLHTILDLPAAYIAGSPAIILFCQ